jgi:hypothetical protein
MNDEAHEILINSAKELNVSLRDYVDAVLIVYMAQVMAVGCTKFLVPQKVNPSKPYAISDKVGEKIKGLCVSFGVSQVNFIYSALHAHITAISGAATL